MASQLLRRNHLCGEGERERDGEGEGEGTQVLKDHQVQLSCSALRAFKASFCTTNCAFILKPDFTDDELEPTTDGGETYSRGTVQRHPQVSANQVGERKTENAAQLA